MRSAVWRWHGIRSPKGEIDEDDESSGPRSNWCGIGPCRSGTAGSGAVVGQSRRRDGDPGGLEGDDDRSALASSALAPPLLALPVNQANEFNGPASRARFLRTALRSNFLGRLHMMTIMCSHDIATHFFVTNPWRAHSWRVQVVIANFRSKDITAKRLHVESCDLKATGVAAA